MYLASSSLRACTLKLPSVVSSSFLRSVKVSDSLTERALRMPRRRRSCTRRSKLAVPPTASRTGFFSRTLREAFDLAAIFHRNHRSENHVQAAEAGHQQRVVEARNQQRHRSQKHEAPAHHRHYAHASGPARKYSAAIKQKPAPGQTPV